MSLTSVDLSVKCALNGGLWCKTVGFKILESREICEICGIHELLEILKKFNEL